jgi:hypothetical protein
MLAVASVITKGRWARPIKRMAEAFSLMTIPMYILLMGFMSFVVLTKAHVYPWAYDLESMPAHKHTYFQPMFVLGRLGLLNGLLVVLNLLFVRASVRSDMGVAKDGSHKGDYQPGMELHAKYTFFAEGARGHLTKTLKAQYDLEANCEPQVYGLGIKELWDIDPAKHVPGRVLHTQGWPLTESESWGGGSAEKAWERDNNGGDDDSGDGSGGDG